MADSEASKATSDGAVEVSAAALGPLRVVLLADEAALHCYGPVLRRLAVGLLDEVSDLSLVSLGRSRLLRYVPSPPVRLLTEERRHRRVTGKVDLTARQAKVSAGMFGFVDKMLPHRRALRLAGALAPYKPTLIHALSERQLVLARHLAHELNVPYVGSVLAIEEGRPITVDVNCRSLLCVNSHVARQLRHRQPMLASRVHVAPIGTHVPSSPCCYRKDGPSSHIFCSCPLEYGYGLTQLINALKQLTLRGHEPHLFLAGEGSAEHALREQAARLELNALVHFVPPIERMLAVSDAYKVVLRETDIFVQPWVAKQWRPELLEAMSIGNAVVAADGRVNDLVVDRTTALSVPFRDDGALTEALDLLLKDRAYARQLAASAQGYVRKHFLVSRMIARLAQTYRKAVL